MRREFVTLVLPLALAAGIGSTAAQQLADGRPPQRGVHVEMVSTGHAVTMPSADAANALVVAVTVDGVIYLRGERTPVSALAAAAGTFLRGNLDKTAYIKADGRVPYARVVEVLDALRETPVEAIALLTVQAGRSATAPAPAASAGLPMRVTNARP